VKHNLVKATLAVCLLMLFSQVAFSETAPQRHINKSVIDGKSSPNSIPDASAYQMFFLGDAVNLANLKLNDNDLNSALRILDNFKREESNLRESYNASITAGAVPDSTGYENKLNALIEATHVALENALTLQGMFNIEKAVQMGKTHITITRTSEDPVPVAPHALASAVAGGGASPDFTPLPCSPNEYSITWVTNTTESNTYTTVTNGTSVTSNVIYTGTATPSIRWAPDCIPGKAATPVYHPAVYNSVAGGGPGLSAPQSIPGGGAFNAGSVYTYVISEHALCAGIICGGAAFGGEVNAEGPTDTETEPIVEEFVETIELEVAYERTATSGARTGCVEAPNGQTECFLSQIAWCMTANHDANVVAVFSETSPLAPFFENWAACSRAGSSGYWDCGPAFSVQNFNQAPGLGFCTYNP
jgi:hypothetical protein